MYPQYGGNQQGSPYGPPSAYQSQHQPVQPPAAHAGSYGYPAAQPQGGILANALQASNPATNSHHSQPHAYPSYGAQPHHQPSPYGAPAGHDVQPQHAGGNMYPQTYGAQSTPYVNNPAHSSSAVPSPSSKPASAPPPAHKPANGPASPSMTSAAAVVEADRQDSEDWDAENEHKRTVTIKSSLEDLKREYGRGTYVYFKMIIFMIGLNLLLSVFALIGFFGSLSDMDNAQDSVAHLFISSYPSEVRWLWYGTTGVMGFTAFCVGPMYRAYQRRISSKWKGEDREEEIERTDEAQLTDKHGAVIHVSQSQRRRRQFISFIVFVLVIGGQGVLTFYLHQALAEQSDERVSLIIAVVVAGLNLFWKKFSKLMTNFERHATVTRHREADVIKVFLLKLSNVMLVYIVKSISGQDKETEQKCLDNASPAEQQSCKCPLNGMGYQFFWFIVVDLTLSNFLELLLPWLKMQVLQRRKLKSKQGDKATKQVFDLSDEYVEVLYRQFVVLLGMIVFPFLTFIAAGAFVLEYWLDKTRLVYICQKPTFKEEPLRGGLIFFCFVLISLVTIVSYPNGMAFIFAGLNLDQCQFFQ